MGTTAKKIKSLLLGGVLMASALLLNPIQANAATQFTGDYFGIGLDYHESDKMEIADGWSNGGMFNCTWRASNVSFSNGYMNLTIDRDYSTGGYSGGEYRTQQAFGYGMYDVSMKAIKNDGVVTSFFTYTGPTDGTVWDEIDIEFLGKDTTKVQFNYFTNGVGGHEYVYDLGFDASQGFHQYGFFWAKDSITWYVDGKAVYTATENIPSTPGKIMMNTWNGIGVDDWLKPYNGATPLTGQYDWFSYTNIDSLNSGSTGNTSNNTTTDSSVNFDSGRTYCIISKNSGKALDVSEVSTQDNANVHQWDYVGGANQLWSINLAD